MTVIVCAVGPDGWALATDSREEGYGFAGENGGPKWRREGLKLLAVSGYAAAEDEMGMEWEIGDPTVPRAAARALREAKIAREDDSVPFQVFAIDGGKVGVWNERWAWPGSFPWAKLGMWDVFAIGAGAEAAMGAAASVCGVTGSARALAQEAVRAACKVSAGCGGMVHVIDLRQFMGTEG